MNSYIKHAKELRNISSETLDPDEFAEYIKDYFENPDEYSIGKESRAFIKAIKFAYEEIEHAFSIDWNVSQVRNSKIYKAYLQVSKNVNEGNVLLENYKRFFDCDLTENKK